MYIIGITGKSGSGKTTFSEMLKNKLNDSTIIHVDYNWIGAIFKLREKMIEIFGKEIFKSEFPMQPLMINGEYNMNLFSELNENVFFSDLNKAKEAYKYIIPETTIKTLNDIKMKHNEYVIIDSLMLPILPELFRICDLKILIEANTETRYKRLEERDEMPCSNDLGEKRDSVCDFSLYECDECIVNNGLNMNELEKKTLHIINRITHRNVNDSDEKQEDINGMITGRFQPFTIGHIEYLKKALEITPKGKKLYIGIGRPFFDKNMCTIGDNHNKSEEANQYTFEERREMINLSVAMDPEIRDRLPDIVVIPFPEQEDELNRVLDYFIPERNIIQYMNIIPGDSWELTKKKLFEKMGFKIKNIVNIERPRIISATEVRRYIKNNDANLIKKVPAGTFQVLEDIRKNGRKKQCIHNVEEFLNEHCITTKDIARQVLPRTPEQQGIVDEAGYMLKSLIDDKEMKIND